MSEKLFPYRDSLIGKREVPLWRRGQFSVDISLPGGPERVDRVIIMPEIKHTNHVDQNSDRSFAEFESSEVIIKSGYQAESMRSHGCGISSLHMVLSTLGGEGYLRKVATVGKLALIALSYHKNDSIDEQGERHIGSPVFNLRAGWYHDALVFLSQKVGGVKAFRSENIDNLDTLAIKTEELSEKVSENILIIVSVTNKFWRLKTEPSSVSTHLVIVNGFKIKNGELVEMRITDPFVSGKPKVDTWIKVDDRIKAAFTGRAMLFWK